MACERPPAAFGGSPPREGETRAQRAKGSLKHHLELLHSISQSQELLAQKARLEPAHSEFLVIVENDRKRAARHMDDAANHFDIDERTAAEAHELSRFKPRSEITQPIPDRIRLVVGRFQVEQLAISDNRNETLDGHKDDLLAAADRYALELRPASFSIICGCGCTHALGFLRSIILALQPFPRAIDCLP